MSVRERQVLAAAQAMWRRDWYTWKPEQGDPGAWEAEDSGIRASYLDSARVALEASAAVRDEHLAQQGARA